MTTPLDGQQVVARYRDGRVVKGTTNDFYPGKGEFHIRDAAGSVTTLAVGALKAIFFVRTFEGDRFHVAMLDQPAGGGLGRRIEVTFVDGEVLTGYTNGYDRSKPGFFLVPADPESNNLRVFVIAGAVRAARWV